MVGSEVINPEMTRPIIETKTGDLIVYIGIPQGMFNSVMKQGVIVNSMVSIA
jgi:hypothetical protein